VTDKPITTAEEMREAAANLCQEMDLGKGTNPYAWPERLSEAIRALPVASPDPLDDPRVRTLVELVKYLADENEDHLRVVLCGNPTVCDALVTKARAALTAFEKDRTDD
jgi:hypothetical protein